MKEMECDRWKWIVFMDHVLDVIIVLNLIAIAILMFIQVLMRYVFRSPLMGIEELCYFPTTWLYLFGAVKASSEKGQLVARVLEIFFKKMRSVYLLRGIAAVLSTLILMWLTYWGYDYLKYALRVDKETDMLFIRWIYAEAIVFVSMALMLFYTVVEVVEDIVLYRKTPVDAPVKSEEVA